MKYISQVVISGTQDRDEISVSVPMFQSNFQFGVSGDGMSQEEADARYVQLSQIEAPDGIAGLDATSLTLLFNNALQ